jgi:hypothetical protein
MAERLAAVFPGYIVEQYPDRHHFDQPQRIEPTEVPKSLRLLWSRAEGS